MDRDETRADEQAPAAEKPPRKLAVGTVLLAVNTVVLVAVLGIQLLRPGVRREARADVRARTADRQEADEKRPEIPEGQPGPTLRLADFVVHLRDADADRYARLSFEMELRDEKVKEAVTARLPQIRDAFLAYLSDRTAEEFRGSESIARVKAALAEKLRPLSPPAGVRALYLTELVVQ